MQSYFLNLLLLDNPVKLSLLSLCCGMISFDFVNEIYIAYLNCVILPEIHQLRLILLWLVLYANYFGAPLKWL